MVLVEEGVVGMGWVGGRRRGRGVGEVEKAFFGRGAALARTPTATTPNLSTSSTSSTSSSSSSSSFSGATEG